VAFRHWKTRGSYRACLADDEQPRSAATLVGGRASSRAARAVTRWWPLVGAPSFAVHTTSNSSEQPSRQLILQRGASRPPNGFAQQLSKPPARPVTQAVAPPQAVTLPLTRPASHGGGPMPFLTQPATVLAPGAAPCAAGADSSAPLPID